MNELRECPFCGMADALEILPYPPVKVMKSVHCVRCGGIGPGEYDGHEVRSWNRRTGPQPMPEEVADTIRGLLESGVIGTKSAIRGRDYHGLRSFNEEDWLRRYEDALQWLDTQPKEGDA